MKTLLVIALLGMVAAASAVSCPDGSQCSSDATCCPTATGSYGCCPTPDATCCSDHQHCCPSEYPVCDVSAGLCKKSGADVFGISMMKKEEATPAPMTACPDGSQCSSDATCCPTATGSYGCCPTPDATCCSDHQHCCPSEYPVCDVSQGLCKKSSTDVFGISMMKKEKTAPAPMTACPDGSQCSSDATCCPTATGSYGCCPTPDATCCSDHQHCCPSEYPVCDVSQGLCKKSSTDVFGIAMMKKEESKTASSPDVFAAELIEEVNAKATTWTAGENEFFAGWTEAELRDYFRTTTDDLSKLPQAPHDYPLGVPSSFDARTQWPGCVGPVLNQARCGSCWAFGAAESISDRMCINDKSNGYVQLSPLDLMTCDTLNNGCQGGAPSLAFMFAQYNGLVTAECQPYLKSNGGPIPTCAPEDQPCLNFVQTPACSKTCTNATASYTPHKIQGYYGVPGEQAMMSELSTKGPFEVTMTVYSDFVHYKSGVYQHTTGQALGGHAIKVIGYGTENGTPYWLIQNSWTTTWGDQGLFKILRGQDECGIEDGGVAGTV